MLSPLVMGKYFRTTQGQLWLVALAVFAIAFSFALYTNHAWEDWYITYRISKNLAIGNGLVFAVGERVHSFTSPLGTLIPAFLNFITANVSDHLVLWLFRLVGCSLLALTAVMLLRIARLAGLFWLPSAALLGLFAIDAKIIDFSINGMETAFMVFFLAAMIYSLAIPSKSVVLRLGLSWAGLMWTRPDSFIYIGGLAVGYLLFLPASSHFATRREMAVAFLKGGGLAVLMYLPWLLWAWSYYGSPIPHTIVAKGLFIPKPDLALLGEFFKFLVNSVIGDSSLNDTFMPAYYLAGGWPKGMVYLSKLMALICTYYWLLPGARPQGRAVSFALFIAHAYLSIYAGDAPWYLPSVTFLSIFVLAQIAQQLLSPAILPSDVPAKGIRKITQRVLSVVLGLVIFSSLSVTLAVAYQVRVQQNVVEDSNRREVGLWLKDQASSPDDTVFLECLGYIGFYSQLKMLDWPGLSSPEVVAARRMLDTDDFAALISVLQPDWLVLRPKEVGWIQQRAPLLLSTRYQQARVFDVSEKIDSYKYLPGRGFLQNDQTFLVYRKRS